MSDVENEEMRYALPFLASHHLLITNADGRSADGGKPTNYLRVYRSRDCSFPS